MHGQQGRTRVTLDWNAPEGRGGFTIRPINGWMIAGISRRALAAARRWRRRLEDHGQEDASWDWQTFTSTCPAGLGAKRLKYEHYSLWVAGELEALMILEISGRRRLTAKAALPQVYVEYLSVAPQNRPGLQHPRKVIGCGAAMVGFSVMASVRGGWHGRVGLHSLPGALTFYKKQGFRDLGPDALEEGFHYMEFGGML